MFYSKAKPDGVEAARRPRKTRGIWWRIGGICLVVSALAPAVVLVNAAAYLLGFGKEVTVTVIDSSTGQRQSDRRNDGRGYYELNGERYAATMSHVDSGDVLDTRLPVIPIGTWVTSGTSAALWDGAMGCVTAPMVVGGIVLIRLGKTRAARSRDYYGERPLPSQH